MVIDKIKNSSGWSIPSEVLSIEVIFLERNYRIILWNQWIERPAYSGRLSRKRHTGMTFIFPESTSISSSSFRVTIVPDFRPNSAMAWLKPATSRFLVTGSAIDSQIWIRALERSVDEDA